MIQLSLCKKYIQIEDNDGHNHLCNCKEFLIYSILTPTAYFFFSASTSRIMTIVIFSILMNWREAKINQTEFKSTTYMDFDFVSCKYTSSRSFSVRAFLHFSLNNPFLQAIWTIRIFLKNSLNLARYFSAKLMSISKTDPPRDFPFEISDESFFVSENSVNFCCRIYLY